ncbi:MAG TPA: DUF4097 family beta strand repeat-containing protein [Candidatus Limnocylindria bacterium]|nr:DUF4097 family beta strand repeat-containing protein [Candidatus Limnocylindria bacterium]
MTEDTERYLDPAEIRHRIGTSGAFNLANVSGDIDIRATDGDEIVVIARGRGRQEWLPLNVRRAEGMLSIDLDQRGPGWNLLGRNNIEVEFDIVLPRGTRVDINTVSGDIEVIGTMGDQSYRSVSGDITLNRVGGRVGVTTVSGDAAVRADEPVESDVSSTSGDLEISGPLLRASKLRTVSGDVQVRGGFEPGAMHGIETVSGDVEIESAGGLTVEVKKGIDLGGGPKQRVIGDGAARLRFRSLSGDLHVMGLGGDRGAEDQPHEHFIPSAPPAPPAPPAAPAPVAPGRSQVNSLEILQMLERGEIDVEEAQRRLEGAATNA